MANSPNPDYVSDVMIQEHGTTVLITNPKSDYYLNRAHESESKRKFSKWCGGKNGWDDYTERWT